MVSNFFGVRSTRVFTTYPFFHQESFEVLADNIIADASIMLEEDNNMEELREAEDSFRIENEVVQDDLAKVAGEVEVKAVAPTFSATTSLASVRSAAGAPDIENNNVDGNKNDNDRVMADIVVTSANSLDVPKNKMVRIWPDSRIIGIIIHYQCRDFSVPLPASSARRTRAPPKCPATTTASRAALRERA